MKDFFSVMGKAFAIVFGSTSALAVVLVLLALAVRPLLKSWVREASVNVQGQKTSVAADNSHDKWEKYRVFKLGECIEWDLGGKCVMTYGPLQLGQCDKDGCSIFRNGFVVGSVSREEITKAQWIPVDQGPK